MSDKRVGPGAIRPDDESKFPIFQPKITRDILPVFSLKAEFDNYIGKPVDQGPSNNCVANQLSIHLDHLRHRLGLPVDNPANRSLPSRMLSWYDARLRGGGTARTKQNSGVAVADAITSAQQIGLCSEVYYGYTKAHWYSTPDKSALAEAAKHKVIEASCLTVKRAPDGNSYVIEDMEACIASGHSFVFGIIYYDNMHTDRNGVLPMPPADKLGFIYDSHALCAIGYDRVKQQFLCRNCKGPNWGYIKGDVLIPYAIMKHPLMVFDAWTATSISG